MILKPLPFKRNLKCNFAEDNELKDTSGHIEERVKGVCKIPLQAVQGLSVLGATLGKVGNGSIKP